VSYPPIFGSSLIIVSISVVVRSTQMPELSNKKSPAESCAHKILQI
jgi:hypothetical protein